MAEIMIRRLSNTFYDRYDRSAFPEILSDRKRPYNVIIKDDLHGLYICIPFRTNVGHRNCFRLPVSIKNTKPALDYSKVILIEDPTYIDTSNIEVDRAQFTDVLNNISKITADITSYIRDYIDFIKGIKNISLRQFTNRYSFSTLPYFSKELGLDHDPVNDIYSQIRRR